MGFWEQGEQGWRANDLLFELLFEDNMNQNLFCFHNVIYFQSETRYSMRKRKV